MSTEPADPRPASPAEFREVLDRAFAMMSEDPEMGPRLREADVPQRFEFTDVDLVFNVRSGRESEDANLVWRWSDDVDFEPKVRMAMTCDVAVRYFQGRENIALALARRRIRASGDVKAALGLIPLVRPVWAPYRAMLEAEYPHLVAP